MKPIDYSKITDIEFDGIDHNDHPDYVDSYISRCLYEGREATDEEIELISQDEDWVYDRLVDYLY